MKLNIIYPISYNAVVLRYNEIGIKGQNRGFFEKMFKEGIRRLLKNIVEISFFHDRGRFVFTKKTGEHFTHSEMELIRTQLTKAFGLESFSPGFILETDWDALKALVTETFPKVHAAHIANNNGAQITYRTRARRSFKKFPLNSKEIEIEMAEMLLEKFTDMKVNLKNAELTLGIEVREKKSFVFYEFQPGPGGLPVSSSDNVLCLMSGGIDSPVACYRAMKRGSHVDYLTFHSFPYTSKDVIEKIGKLIQKLNGWQYPGKYFACNMIEAQKMIRDNCTERFRTILYRRIMMRVAEIVAKYLNINVLLTGESVGQVASQTLKNMDVINRSTDMLILRPLVSMDKNETISLAQDIGTLDISNIPAEDSCTVFSPSSPATNSNPKLIEENEGKLDLPALIKTCLENTLLIDPVTCEETPIPELLSQINT